MNRTLIRKLARAARTLAIIIATFALMLVAAMVGGSQGAHGSTIATAAHGHGSAPPPPHPVCGMAQRAAQQAGATWVLSRPNPFSLAGTPKVADEFCIEAGGAPGFRILTNVPAPRGLMAYPFTGVGCAYDLCSRGTDLPKRVGRLASATSSWTWHGPTRGYWNASYDLWFDRRDQISTQDNMAELMIWLRTPPGYPYGAAQRKVFIDGRWMWFMTWVTGHAGMHWHYVQFRFMRTVHSVRGLRLWPFIRFAIRRHLIRWGSWMTSVHAGYEIWSGGKGLATTWFTART